MNCRQPKEEHDAQSDRPTCGDRAGDRLTSSGSVGEGEGNLRLQAGSGAYVGSLGRMATVETGDPRLDALAHAVAIDHLRRDGA